MSASAGALRAGRAFVEFALQDGAVRKGLDSLEKKFKAVGERMQSIGKVGMAIGAGILAPLGAAVTAAADAQEGLAKFQSVFAEQTAAANQFAEDLAAAVGRSAHEIRAAMSSFQGFFVGLGFGQQQSREFSQQLQALSLDFAAFHNLSDEEAMDRFLAGLSGSGEVFDRFGINIKQAALEQELLNQGIEKSWTDVTEQEKAVARLNVIMKGMTAQGAVGAAVREAGSFANQLKALKAEVLDMSIQVGEVLLPYVVDFIKSVREIVVELAGWASQNTDLVKILGAVGIGVGTLGAAMYALGTALTVMGTAAGAASTALAFLVANPVVAALAAVGATIGWLVYEFYKARDAVTVFDEALKGLDGKRTVLEADDVQALITRYDQLAKKTKLTKEEEYEAAKVMLELRKEFGNLDVAQKDGRLQNVDRVKAQIMAAQGGKSFGIQNQALAQAEAALSTRKLEGAGAEEIAQREGDLAKMREELARTARIVKDATPAVVAKALSIAVAPAESTAEPIRPAAVEKSGPSPFEMLAMNAGDLLKSAQGGAFELYQEAQKSVAAIADGIAEMHRTATEQSAAAMSTEAARIGSMGTFSAMEAALSFGGGGVENETLAVNKAQLEELRKANSKKTDLPRATA